MFGIAIVCVIFAGFCFFMAHKTKIENENRRKIEEDRRAAEQEKLDRVRQINEEIDKLWNLRKEIISASHAEFEKKKDLLKEYQAQIDKLEKERYELTGQPTSTMIKYGIGIMRNNPPIPETQPKKEFDPVLTGMSTALLTNAVAEKQKKEREHKKEIKELKDEIRKLRGR